MAQHRHLGKDFKAGPAIEAIKGEKTNNEIASIYEIHPNQVGKWKKPALEKLRRTQIDQAVLAYQDVLWHHRERCEDSNLDCRQRLCSGSDCQKRTQSRAEFGRNLANSQHCTFRESPCYTSTYEKSFAIMKIFNFITNCYFSTYNGTVVIS